MIGLLKLACLHVRRQVPVGSIRIVSLLSSVASTASCCKALKLLTCQYWYSNLSSLSGMVAIAQVSLWFPHGPL